MSMHVFALHPAPPPDPSPPRRYAQLERKLGEIDRARAILVHISALCDPRRDKAFWAEWKDFEVAHGNEDTFREMLRIQRCAVHASPRWRVCVCVCVCRGGTKMLRRSRGPSEGRGRRTEARAEGVWGAGRVGRTAGGADGGAMPAGPGCCTGGPLASGSVMPVVGAGGRPSPYDNGVPSVRC